MSTQNHIPKQIIRSAFSVAEKLEPLKTRKDPVVAAVAAFALGGIGLGIYLESLVDFFVPWIIVLLLLVFGIPFGGLPLFFAPVFWAVWAYRRVKASNTKLAFNNADILEAEIIADPQFSRAVQIPATQSRQDREFRLRKLNELYHEGVLTPGQRDDEKKEILSKL